MNDAISAEMVRNEIRRGTAIAMSGLFPRAGAISIPREDRTMIEIIEGLPENVVGILAKGEVTRKDYLEVVIPAIEKSLKRNASCGFTMNWVRIHRNRLRRRVGRLQTRNRASSSWERVAVVTDVAWIRHAVNAFRFLMPGEVRVFATGQTSEARKWIVALA